jgi:uridine phosphorylase
MPLLRDMTQADWLSWLDLDAALVPQALILRGTRNLKRQYDAHRAHFDDVVEVGSPNGLFEDVFIGRRGAARVAYASVYGAPMASEITHVFAVLGTRLVVQTGCCGGLDDALATGDLFLAREAHPGEGAAQYYPTQSPELTASIDIERWRQLPAAADAKLFEGRIYSTGALLAEGEAELAAWHAAGCSAVDMETAATFAVAEHFGIERASILFVFDNPRRKDHMLLADAAKDGLRSAANQQMIELTLALVEQFAESHA